MKVVISFWPRQGGRKDKKHGNCQFEGPVTCGFFDVDVVCGAPLEMTSRKERIATAEQVLGRSKQDCCERRKSNPI